MEGEFSKVIIKKKRVVNAHVFGFLPLPLILPALLVSNHFSNVELGSTEVLGKTLSQNKVQLKKIEVKPAGVSVSVPKSWKSYPADGTYTASLKVPGKDPKVEGRYDIGYVSDDLNDVEGFQTGVAGTLATRGDKLIEQYVSEVLGGNFAFSKYSKGDRTSVRGVLFRPTKQKLVVLFSAPTTDFDALFPSFQDTLQTLSDIKVVEAKPVNAPPEPKLIRLEPNLRGRSVSLPVKVPISIAGKGYQIELPRGATSQKLSEDSFSIVAPGVNGSIVVNTGKFSGTVEPIGEVLSILGKNTSLFEGGIERVNDFDMYSDQFQRFFSFRRGVAVKSKQPLGTIECLIAGKSEAYMHCNYLVKDMKNFEIEKKLLVEFMSVVRIEAQK